MRTSLLVDLSFPAEAETRGRLPGRLVTTGVPALKRQLQDDLDDDFDDEDDDDGYLDDENDDEADEDDDGEEEETWQVGQAALKSGIA